MSSSSVETLTSEVPVSQSQTVSGLTMVICSGDLDKVLAAFIIANGAAAMDLPVSMFFTFWGLNALRREGPIELSQPKTFMEKMFGWMMPRGPNKLTLSRMNMLGLGTMLMKKEMAKKNAYDLPKLMKSAQEQGVKLVGCTMTMDIMGIRKEELIPDISYGGVGTFLDAADRSRITLFV
jgi:peroxiredoxin family protein